MRTRRFRTSPTLTRRTPSTRASASAELESAPRTPPPPPHRLRSSPPQPAQHSDRETCTRRVRTTCENNPTWPTHQGQTLPVRTHPVQPAQTHPDMARPPHPDTPCPTLHDTQTHRTQTRHAPLTCPDIHRPLHIDTSCPPNHVLTYVPCPSHLSRGQTSGRSNVSWFAALYFTNECAVRPSSFPVLCRTRLACGRGVKRRVLSTQPFLQKTICYLHGRNPTRDAALWTMGSSRMDSSSRPISPQQRRWASEPPHCEQN